MLHYSAISERFFPLYSIELCSWVIAHARSNNFALFYFNHVHLSFRCRLYVSFLFYLTIGKKIGSLENQNGNWGYFSTLLYDFESNKFGIISMIDLIFCIFSEDPLIQSIFKVSEFNWIHLTSATNCESLWIYGRPVTDVVKWKDCFKFVRTKCFIGAFWKKN